MTDADKLIEQIARKLAELAEEAFDDLSEHKYTADAAEIAAILSPSRAREEALEEAAKVADQRARAFSEETRTRIGGTPDQLAYSRGAEASAQIIALAIRALASEGQPSPADMAAFCASDAACYHWPGDTEQDRACREAYCRGAADIVQGQPSPLGYVNVYADKDGDIELGGTDLYESVNDAREFNASEFETYLGVAVVALVGQPSPAQGVPEGWKLTPREMNDEMRAVAWKLILGNLRPDEIWKYIWDAAPAPLSSADRTIQE